MAHRRLEKPLYNSVPAGIDWLENRLERSAAHGLDNFEALTHRRHILSDKYNRRAPRHIELHDFECAMILNEAPVTVTRYRAFSLDEPFIWNYTFTSQDRSGTVSLRF